MVIVDDNLDKGSGCLIVMECISALLWISAFNRELVWEVLVKLLSCCYCLNIHLRANTNFFIQDGISDLKSPYLSSQTVLLETEGERCNLLNYTPESIGSSHSTPLCS